VSNCSLFGSFTPTIIAAGRYRRGVAQQFLNGGQINASIEKIASERPAEIMPRKCLSNSGLLATFSQHLCQRLIAYASSPLDFPTLENRTEKWSSVCSTFFQPTMEPRLGSWV